MCSGSLPSSGLSGEDPWHFLTLPEAISDEIRSRVS